MRHWLALVMILASCIPARIDAQTNPLWSEQKVKNFLPHMAWPEVRDLLTRSDIALIPVQDVLGLGSEARMNAPGQPTGNWGWRMRAGVFSKALQDRLRDLALLYERN